MLLVTLLFKFRRTLGQLVKVENEESTVPLPVVVESTRQINLIPEQPINLERKSDVTYIPLIVQKIT